MEWRSERKRVVWIALAVVTVVISIGGYFYFSKWRPHPLAFNTRTIALDDGSNLRVFILPRGNVGRDRLWVVHDAAGVPAVVLLDGWEYSGTEYVRISPDGEIRIEYMPLGGGDAEVTLDLRAAKRER